MFTFKMTCKLSIQCILTDLGGTPVAKSVTQKIPEFLPGNRHIGKKYAHTHYVPLTDDLLKTFLF